MPRSSFQLNGLVLLCCLAITGAMACTGEVKIASLEEPSQSKDRYEYVDGTTVVVPVKPDDPTIPTPDPGTDVPMMQDPCAGAQDPGVAPMRTLTRQEFEHAMGELFEGMSLSYPDLPPDERIGSFAINGSAKVTEQYVNAFRAIAEELSVSLRDDESAWLGCAGEADARACTQSAMQDFVPKLYRRSLKSGELERVMGVYDFGVEEGGHTEGVRIMMEALLQSPSFIYTYTTSPEGTSGERVALDDMQIAQRMATLLWRGIPDDELWAAAARGELSDPATRRAQAERMLDDPRARVALNAMVLQWFDVDSLNASHLGQIENPDRLLAAMQQESARLIDHVLWEREGDYRELFTTPYTFVDQAMVDHYGIDAGDLTDEVEPGIWRVALPGRQGILTHASVLAHEADVIHRGKRIRNNILCGDVPGPGDDIDTEAIPTFPTETERSKANNRMEVLPCSGCHLQMDNIGLTFDLFDELGVARTQDKHGNEVTSLGEVRSTLDINGPVSGVEELVEKLSASQDVRECVAENIFTYSFARRSDVTVDACTVHTIGEALETHQGNLKLALLSVIDTATFTTTRQP